MTESDASEDKALQAEVELIEKEVAANQAEISLDQPHPEEMHAPQPINPTPTPAEETEAEPAKVAGYTATDIVEAPVKPPQPEVTENKAATKDPKVKFLVYIGAGLLVLGVLLFFVVSPGVGAAIAALGGILAVVAVFVPLHKLGHTAKNPKK